MEKGFILPGGQYVQAIDAGEKRDDEGKVTRPERTAADYPEGTIEVPLNPGPEYDWDGSQWVHTPPDPAEVLAEKRANMPNLSKSQLLIGLVAEGWITEAEGDAWLQGTALPSIILGAIGQLPQNEQFAARARAYSMTFAERTDPLVGPMAEALAANFGVPVADVPETVDTFFETYSQV